MAAELPQPGVQIIQEFRTVSPSVVTPTLVPCIVGACRQIVEVLNGQALNADSKVALSALFTASNASLSGSRYVYTGLNGKQATISVNNSPDVEVLFSQDYLTPAAVVDAFNTALSSLGVFGAVAETVKEHDAFGALIERTWRLRSVAPGALQKIDVSVTTDPEVWDVFGLKPGWSYTGADFYNGTWLEIPVLNFPDPRNNLDELAIESDTIRLFFATSPTNIRELQTKQAFCRRGGSAYAYDDGNGDAMTPFIDLKTAAGSAENLTAAATGAVLTGSVVLTALTLPADLEGKTLTLQAARAAQTYTFVDTASWPLSTHDEAIAQLNAYFGDFLFAVDGSHHLTITTKDLGQDAAISVLGGTAQQTLGLLCLVGTVDTTGISYPADLEGKSISLGGVSYTFASGHPTNRAELLSLLTTQFPTLAFTANAAEHLVISATSTADIVLGAGTANTVLGVTAGTVDYTAGVSFPAQAGDELFVEGLSFGSINQVAPGGVTGRLRMAKQLTMANAAYTVGTIDLGTLTFPSGVFGRTLILDGTTYTLPASGTAPADVAALLVLLTTAFPAFTFTSVESGSAHHLTITKVGTGPFTLGSGTLNSVVGLTAATYSPLFGVNFYIVARNLTGAAARPVPELQVSSGVPIIAPHLLRDTAGAPLTTSSTYAYMMYKALRQDVSPAAARPGLLSVGSTTDVTDALAPISTENPLALGLYMALLNAPNTTITGIGVDEVTDGAPEGTVEAFTRAAEFLEGAEVYAIAPLTHDKTVGEVFNAHVTAMSSPENKGERICLFNNSMPTHKLDTLVSSGASGDSLGVDTFDTKVPNLSALLLIAGIPNPIGAIGVDNGVYLDVGDGSKFSIATVNGGVVTIRRTFTGGANDDGFYAEAPGTLFPPEGVAIIDGTFAIRIRGAALKLPTGKPDKAGIALTVQQYAQALMNRRFWHIVPDKCAATIGGIEQQIEGFYLCAGYVGLIAGKSPSQSFTNFPLTGFTRVIGSNDTFTNKQLNIMAAGGNWIVVQEGQNAPLTARMALTTDMTSIETRTDSITKVVDFTAKILRRGYRNFIGRFNITSGFLDSLAHVGQGILTFLMESGVLIGGSLNNIVQDEKSPDTVLVDCTLDPPYPCNYLRLTLII